MLNVEDSTAGAKAARKEDQQTSEDERIYRDIFLAIIEQKLLPGTKLKEDQLCDIYQVSRARIREILARLSHDKIVTRISNRGAFVAEPTVEEAREVFAARRLIEGHLVRLLAEGRYKGSSKALEAQLECERRARNDGTFSQIIREAGAFHMALAELAESPILGGFLRELISRTSLISAAYERGAPAKCEFEEHRELIACIVEGRAEDAATMMSDHLDGIESRLDLSPPREPQASLGEILGHR